MDNLSPEQRKRTMKAVKSRDTAPEMFVRRTVHRAGFRYGLHRSDLPGNPDMVLRRFDVTVFVHGCFWHGHDCDRFRLPASNVEYWRTKINRNRARDARVQKELRDAGWTPWVIWECRLEEGVRELIHYLEDEASHAG